MDNEANRKRVPGLLSEKTLIKLREAAEAHVKAWILQEEATLRISTDACGVPLGGSIDNVAAVAPVRAANAYPLFQHIWKMLASMDVDGNELERLLNLETTR